MVNITVKYKGLTGNQGSITIDNADTGFDDIFSMITCIYAAGPAQQPDSLAGDRDVHRFKQIVDLVV